MVLDKNTTVGNKKNQTTEILSFQDRKQCRTMIQIKECEKWTVRFSSKCKKLRIVILVCLVTCTVTYKPTFYIIKQEASVVYLYGHLSLNH